MQLVELSQRKQKQHITRGGVANDTGVILLPFVTSQRDRFENLVMFPMPSEKRSEQKKSRLHWQDRDMLYCHEWNKPIVLLFVNLSLCHNHFCT